MSDLRIRLLPVEFGDCILLRLPDDSWAIVDAGGKKAAEQAAGILQNTQPTGKPVRFILATHHHADHIGGMPTLLGLCPKPIGAFYYCPVEREVDDGTQRGFLDYVQLARGLQTSGQIGTVSALRAGHVIALPLSPPNLVLRMAVLHPGQAQVDQGPVSGNSELNNASVVLQMDFHGVHVLLAGDIEDSAWSHVLGRPEFEPPRVLKVPHHGSINGRPPQRFFDQVESGAWALLSTPTENPRFPDPRTLSAFWEASCMTRCTGACPDCDLSNQELYPVRLDDRKYSESLRVTLLLTYGSGGLRIPYESRIGCCVENELVIAPSGRIAHSRPSKTCDDCSQSRRSGP